jgi:hypothetical protein
MMLKYGDTLRFNLRVCYVCASVKSKGQSFAPAQNFIFERIRGYLRCVLVLLV